jgi:hypothetical protein
MASLMASRHTTTHFIIKEKLSLNLGHVLTTYALLVIFTLLSASTLAFGEPVGPAVLGLLVIGYIIVGVVIWKAE